MKSRTLSAFLAAAFLAVAAPVLAQTAQQAPQQQSPQQPAGPLQPNETKLVGDWMVRCFPVKSPSPCDMFELLADKKSGRRLMSLSLAYIPVNDRHAIQIALPLGVDLAKGAYITSDTYNSPQLHFRRCDRMGCYIEGLIDNASVDALSRASTGAKVKFTAFGGQTLDLPFSLKGFVEAHSTMTDMAKSHVSMAGGKSAGH